MRSIRIKNLRSLKDTTEIELRPLTILVGNNSSGKSTFLRSFPLLKQTIRERTSEPILWYGNEVDFGTFEESLTRGIEEKTICFEFNLKFTMKDVENMFSIKLKKINEKEELEASLKIFLEKKYYNKIEVTYMDNYIEYFFEKNKLKKLLLNGKELKEYSKGLAIVQNIYSNGLIPNITNKKSSYKANLFPEPLAKYLNSIKGINDEIKKELSIVLIGSKKDIFNYIDSYIEVDENIKKDILDLNFIKYFNLFIDIIDLKLLRELSSVRYVAPIRAKAERYYRVQGLDITEITPTGENIAVYLNNLNTKDRNELNKWIKEKFGFEIKATFGKGHISLEIKPGNQNEFVNLIDTGFGYSQILPIIINSWECIKRARNKYILVIEQPELHLHPNLQAKLIDCFIEIATKFKNQIILVLETHSETMINRIGEHIALKKIESDLIGINVFEKDEKLKNTTIKKGYFDDEGYLENWPTGFFYPEELN